MHSKEPAVAGSDAVAGDVRGFGGGAATMDGHGTAAVQPALNNRLYVGLESAAPPAWVPCCAQALRPAVHKHCAWQ